MRSPSGHKALSLKLLSTDGVVSDGRQQETGSTDIGEHRLTPPRRKHGEVKDDKKTLLKLIRSKLNGNHTASELEEPLEYRSRCKTRAVLVVTSAIDINGIQVTRLASKLLMKSAGLSLDSLSHWALVAVDRGEGTCYLYDLMSDQMLPTTKIMKNYRMHSHFLINPSRTVHGHLRPPHTQLTHMQRDVSLSPKKWYKHGRVQVTLERPHGHTKKSWKSVS